MSSTCFYDKEGERLIYIKSNATSDYWDNLWNSETNWIEEKTKKVSLNSPLFRLIDRFLSPGAKILEAGCGRGQFVYGLYKKGYDAVGVDFAENTVRILNQKLPELKIFCGDINNLATLQSSSFDAYYSGGVIEHFWYGYTDILREARRVLRPDGKLIITFPFMSRARQRNKTSFERWNKESPPPNFYQFALNLKRTELEIEKFGFTLLYRNKRNGLKGFIEQYPNFHLVEKLYKSTNRNIAVKGFRFLLSTMLAKIGYGHTVELVFNREN